MHDDDDNDDDDVDPMAPIYTTAPVPRGPEAVCVHCVEEAGQSRGTKGGQRPC